MTFRNPNGYLANISFKIICINFLVNRDPYYNLDSWLFSGLLYSTITIFRSLIDKRILENWSPKIKDWICFDVSGEDKACLNWKFFLEWQTNPPMTNELRLLTVEEALTHIAEQCSLLINLLIILTNYLIAEAFTTILKLLIKIFTSVVKILLLMILILLIPPKKKNSNKLK